MLLQLAILKFVARQVACGGGNTSNKALQQCCSTSCKEMLPVLLGLYACAQCVRARACVRACASVHARTCNRACAHARTCNRACVRVRASACVYALMKNSFLIHH